MSSAKVQCIVVHCRCDPDSRAYCKWHPHMLAMMTTFLVGQLSVAEVLMELRPRSKLNHSPWGPVEITLRFDDIARQQIICCLSLMP